MKFSKAVLIFLCLSTCGCSSLQTTSTSRFAMLGEKPPPQVVGVAFFEGEEPYATNTRRDFYNALRQGDLFVKVYSTDDLREAMDWSTKDFLAPEARRQLQKRLGIQGIFTANVSAFKNIIAGNAHIYMDLIDIENGNKLWSCHAQDDRLVSESVSFNETTARAIQNAYKQLQKDLH